MTLNTYRSIIESHGRLSLIFSPLSVHPIQARLTHYFVNYATCLVSYQKVEPESQFQNKKWGIFSTDLLVRTSFYFMNEITLSKHPVSKKLPSNHVGKYQKL